MARHTLVERYRRTNRVIRLKDGGRLPALYDHKRRAVTVEGATVLERLLTLWVRQFYGCEIASISKPSGGKKRGNGNAP